MQAKIFFSVCVLLLFLGARVACADALEDSYAPLPTAAPAATVPPTPTSNGFTAPILAEINRYQKFATAPWEDIPEGKLKFGVKAERVFKLKERLIMTGDLMPAEKVSNRFDGTLEDGVKKFQTRHGLEADGIVGAATRQELNVPPQIRVQQLQVNLDRLQKLAAIIPDRYIIVNVPEFAMHLFDRGQEVLNMKAIVGKPENATPELSSKITRLIFYPYWNVPNRIAANDIVPKALHDPYYLDDMHIKVFINRGGDDLQAVRKQDVDWQEVQANENSPYQFRQEPGDGNSLGIVKFEFPNKYNVYLHDTPAKSLFETNNRALSHGCVRLERPMDLVSYLLQDNPNWNESDTQLAIDNHKTKYVELKRPIKIFIAYLTAWPDQNGVVNYRNDIYHLDSPDADGIYNPNPEPEDNFY